MRLNRTLLYVGAFLVAIGGIVVVADAGRIDTATLVDVVRAWPLAVIAVGAGLVLRRTRLSLPAGLAAAIAPGLLIGSAFAIVPRFAGDCGARGDAVSTATEAGVLGTGASVSIRTGCGTLSVGTSPGSAWQLTAANTAGRPPTVRSSPEFLSISGGRTGWIALTGGRDAWDLTLPTSQIDDLSLVMNAGRSSVGLAGARIANLDLTANVSDAVVDATGASIDGLSTEANMSRLSIHLPAGSDLVGTVHVDAGELQLCAPPGTGLRLTTTGVARDLRVAGEHIGGSVFQNPDYASATHRADLTVTVNFGAVEINPIGGCRLTVSIAAARTACWPA